MKRFKNVLVLAPHPDDGEFGCGGSIHKLHENKAIIHYAAFSPCIASIPKEKNKQILFDELNKATSHLGINNKNIYKYDFPVRKFSEHRQEILEELIKLKNNLNPDLVLLPNSNDLHQDHSVIYQEGLRAFKHVSILGYELPWNNLKFTSNYHFILNQSNLDAKLKAISEYKSQNFRTYKSKEYWKGLAVVRGNQVGAKFAEAFEAIRLIN